MVARGTPLVVAAAAITLILIGILTTSWWTASVGGGIIPVVAEVNIGLRKVAVCSGGQCIEGSFSAFSRGGGKTYRTFGALTYFAGFVLVIALGIGVFLREYHDTDWLARKAGIGCMVLVPLSLITVFSLPESDQAVVDISLGYSFYLTLVGSIVGIIAGFTSGESLVSLRLGRPTVSASAPTSVSTTPAATAAGADAISQKVATGTLQQSSRPAAPGDIQPPAEKEEADTTRKRVRFVARSCEISEVGLSAIMASGGQRDLLWSDIGSLEVWFLPPGQPFQRKIFVDIVPLGRPTTPIRILPSTRVNYRSLPGQTGADVKDNLRRLGAFICKKNPGVTIEPRSKGFFYYGQPAPTLQSAQQLDDYDGQFLS